MRAMKKAPKKILCNVTSLYPTPNVAINPHTINEIKYGFLRIKQNRNNAGETVEKVASEKRYNRACMTIYII